MDKSVVSSRSLGLKFAQQYYTVLNEDPSDLDRFYNEGSVFDHDPETGPVFGRQQIRQKIHELNFQNCRTKIKRIDSQDTSGNDIMVRVTGDISNAGGPMRRFTQTFVLAEETRKKTSNKYFIHSDIFRYQDEILISDEECEVEDLSEDEEDSN